VGFPSFIVLDFDTLDSEKSALSLPESINKFYYFAGDFVYLVEFLVGVF